MTILKILKKITHSLSFVLVVATPLSPANAGSSHAPYLSSAASEDFISYMKANENRAFAIAPGGAWGWAAGSATENLAEMEALNNCRQYTEQPCHVFALNDQVVIDQAEWNMSWKLAAPNAGDTPRTGISRGDVFPDLAFFTADGKQASLSDYTGKTVFLHFWGSWCPPCKSELPGVNELHSTLVDDDQVAFILLQVREPFSVSKRWISRQNLTVPLHDSGQESRTDDRIRLSSGDEVGDRYVAGVFPTTYILDSNRRVVFSQSGPEENWIQYETLIRNAD